MNFYIRHYENLVSFFASEIMKNKKEFGILYKKNVDSKDAIVPVSKKTWEDLVMLLYYIT